MPLESNYEQLIEDSAEFDIDAQTLYALLCDYDKAHAYFVPPKYFEPLVVKKGGYGEGTIIGFTVTILGNKRVMEAIVSEPEPGRVLAEDDIESGVYTRFTVDPISAQKCRLTIETFGRPEKGLRAWIERKLNPIILRKITQEEFVRINTYLKEEM